MLKTGVNLNAQTAANDDLLACSTALVSSSSARESAAPQRGGTLRLLGTGDIFNLDTTSGYYTVLNIISRAL